MTGPQERVLAEAAALLADTLDVIEGRPVDGTPPAALVARGWAPFLDSLEDAVLDALERDGLHAVWPAHTPPSLAAMLARARAATDFPRLTLSPPRDVPALRHVAPRKQAQVEAVSAVLLDCAADAPRILDVGSGHGHLTREIAARIGRPVVGLERNPLLIDRARQLAQTEDAPRFDETDVLRDGLPLEDGDCVMGLHACGALGDAMVRAVTARVAAGGRASLVLVGCCLQKRPERTRAPLSARGTALARDVLGLSNLTPRDVGVEASLGDNLAARQRRLALSLLLQDAGRAVPAGTELVGLNRRAAHATLEALAARAFSRAALPCPGPDVIAAAAARAHAMHARMRRHALPRSMLARVLEVAVLADRAQSLADSGLRVETGVLFPDAVSARNLVLVARP